MRIRCPSCAATYEVADALLDPPRTVRCARCAHDWMAAPVEEAPPPEPAPAEDATPASVPTEEPVAIVEATPEPTADNVVPLGDTPLSAIERLNTSDFTPRGRRRDHWLTAAWAASFAILAALGVAGYTQRDALMRHWPASKRVYATLGLAPLEIKTENGAIARPPGPVDGAVHH